MAATLLAAAFKTFGRNWVRIIINDGVDASARKSQVRFQVIQVSSSAEPRMRLEKSENLPAISLSQPQSHHNWFLSIPD